MKFLCKWLLASLAVAVTGAAVFALGYPSQARLNLGLLIMGVGYAGAVAAMMLTVDPLRRERLRWLRLRLAETERVRLAYRDAARRNFHERRSARERLYGGDPGARRDLAQIDRVIDVARARRVSLKRQRRKLEAAIAELAPVRPAARHLNPSH